MPDPTVASAEAHGEPKKPGLYTHILSSAIDCLIDSGVAATTTVAVQSRAKVSRGALLHHFPTRADLIEAVIDEIVLRNEQVIVRRLKECSQQIDPVEAAIDVLVRSTQEPTFLAELELWVSARTDSALRTALGAAERKAAAERKRVLDRVFGHLRDLPEYETIVDISVEIARGLAISNILRRAPEQTTAHLAHQWAQVVRRLVTQH